MPVISTLSALVTRPLVSTVTRATLFDEPYVPALTPVAFSLAVVTASSAIFDVVTAASLILAVVTAASLIFGVVTAASLIFGVVTAPSARRSVTTAPTRTVGFGYVPARSPPAGPTGGALTMVTLSALTIRPLASIVTRGTLVAEPYVPATTPVASSFAEVTAPSAMRSVTTAP